MRISAHQSGYRQASRKSNSQVFGDGPVDLVFFPGFVSNIEVYWEEPSFARWLHKLSRFSRVIMFDKRGTGLSDRLERLPNMDERMDDVRAVRAAATGSWMRWITSVGTRT
jgi:pimeloyl-ACP methyl ester carboxylesterase